MLPAARLVMISIVYWAFFVLRSRFDLRNFRCGRNIPLMFIECDLACKPTLTADHPFQVSGIQYCHYFKVIHE